MSAFYQQKRQTDKPKIMRCIPLQEDWVREYIDRMCTSALTAGLKPVIKMAIAGVVDEMEQDALRVASNSAQFAVVRGVNTVTVKVTNSGFNGQGNTQKQGGKSSEKSSKRMATDPCFRCGTVGHWKDECRMEMKTTAFGGNAAMHF